MPIPCTRLSSEPIEIDGLIDQSPAGKKIPLYALTKPGLNTPRITTSLRERANLNAEGYTLNNMADSVNGVIGYAPVPD